LSKDSTKYRLVPRAPGDTTPLDPVIAEALRKAGKDPSRFTVVPYEPGEAVAPFAALFPPGARVEHAFAFATLNGALSAIERIVDDEMAARIGKQGAKWLVVFDGPADPNRPAKSAHETVAARVSDLGGEDRGFSHLTMNVTKKEG
jgi:hypothetical protein